MQAADMQAQTRQIIYMLPFATMVENIILKIVTVMNL